MRLFIPIRQTGINMPKSSWLFFFIPPSPYRLAFVLYLSLELLLFSPQPQVLTQMYRLVPGLIPDAGDHGESLPWTIEIEKMCSECGTFCDHPSHLQYTPPQTPSLQGFSNLTHLNASLHASAASRNESASYPDTPYYPHAPPSTPITAHSDLEHPIQFWRSDVHKSTINFPPSELPEHLRDGSWCHMPPAQAELAVLFGLEAATPLNWTPTGTVQSPDDPGCSKFFWGPLQLQLDSTNSSDTQMLPQQSPPSVRRP